MLLEKYVNQSSEGFSFSRKQACEFAKQVATDFNPIHDEDAKRFCVPGDLLFAYLLTRYGVTEQLSCQFAGMVGADVMLHCIEQDNLINICDHQGKVYLSLQRSGACQHDLAVIEPLIRDYVKFSGQNFPHILQPLMQKHQVMINPTRPLVIYESMALSFNRLPTQKVELSLTNSSLIVEGKRGNVLLEFSLTEQGEQIGNGQKRMILSNLMSYDEAQMEQMVAEYDSRKVAVW
ncbi:MAG: DUF3581 domain-containing protein [Gammaproteobacteria bacterium]|nr:DUF3581 domain-containing protein [Gammaproteobacteria bacterium]MBU1437201.1 DUF3581 domain-containing protein [Gammaproteobacteria bacterium]MBU2070152.1 DUF3581 domain-containing protein [Gammaproteobacteria bacterium]MBU2183597.1 DUF3581 domain-containing protein [Gammaproteobacteria bacterium]MBU2204748.1 DUF3581 domain-containing protein [Gammaproteobacteria bacterium]